MNNIQIAVIGKSSAGKSAFIRLFSNVPSYLDNVGEGQTTRAYAEYSFLNNYRNKPRVEARLMTQEEFVENRISQVYERFINEISSDTYDLAWLSQQMQSDVYADVIKVCMLNSDDFFNIEEFNFIDESKTVNSILGAYEKFKAEIINLSRQDIENADEDNPESINLRYKLHSFYTDTYKMLIGCINRYFENSSFYVYENGNNYFRFEINDENKDLFSQIIKVVSRLDGNAKDSYSSLISKTHITSGLSETYAKIFNKIGLMNITLIDTYGLDHDRESSKDALRERYNRIFNIDYPNISVAFLIHPLRSGADTDFAIEVKTLFETKPEIMSYVVGTYVDENELTNDSEKHWLMTKSKVLDEAPALKGKLLQKLKSPTLVATIHQQGISETMAKKRCEIIRTRFAPFCGKLEKLSCNDFYDDVNKISIESLFESIINMEHLGDGYINIDIIKHKLTSETIKPFLESFVKTSTEIFQHIYNLTAPRTRWRVRVNLENGILGFAGSTIDATWVRVFRDAYYKTFSKEINVNGRNIMLSDTLGMEGNSKIAFDELLNKSFPYIFKQMCINQEKLYAYANELRCHNCFTDDEAHKNCVWKQFIILANREAFKQSQGYPRIIDWLYVLHNFTEKSIKSIDFNEKFLYLVHKFFSCEFIILCTEHNMFVASKKVAENDKYSVSEAKNAVFNDYKKNFDNDIEASYFNEQINIRLSERPN